MADKLDEIDFSRLFEIKTPKDLDTNLPILQFMKVKQASNGMEALEILTEHKDISAIVCDMVMPVLGGLDLLAELRERTDLNRPPFALAMDQVTKERLMLAVESGVDEILVKPFTLKDIYPKIHTAWKKYHNPKNPEKAYELAKIQLRSKNWDEADKIYTLLGESAKKSARPLVGLARVFVGKGDLFKALECLQQAETRNKSYVHIFAARGEIYAQQKKFDDALASFEQAIALSPLNPVRYKSAADILMLRERYSDAVSLLEKAVKEGLEFKELYIHLSQAYFMMKDYPKAVRYVRSALGIDPENVTFLNQMGICLKNMNQPDEATKVYNQIIKLDPDNVAALYNKAMLNDNKGEFAEAVKLLERAVKKDPSFSQAKNKLDEVKRKLGNAA
ncbi:MAG: tetratricopeptide repeat protein [Proteobacteria bacterium]|nr:tetratricopeptide repeat protein [Pseudomonadota bacterium]